MSTTVTMGPWQIRASTLATASRAAGILYARQQAGADLGEAGTIEVDGEHVRYTRRRRMTRRRTRR